MAKKGVWILLLVVLLLALTVSVAFAASIVRGHELVASGSADAAITTSSLDAIGAVSVGKVSGVSRGHHCDFDGGAAASPAY